jgi:hypothetical protein
MAQEKYQTIKKYVKFEFNTFFCFFYSDNSYHSLIITIFYCMSNKGLIWANIIHSV